MEIVCKNVFSCRGGAKLLQKVFFVWLSKEPLFCEVPAMFRWPVQVLPGHHETNQVPLQQEPFKVDGSVCGNKRRLPC